MIGENCRSKWANKGIIVAGTMRDEKISGNQTQGDI